MSPSLRDTLLGFGRWSLEISTFLSYSSYPLFLAAMQIYRFSNTNFFICKLVVVMNITNINDREYRTCNLKWTIQRHWQHSAHKTEEKQNKNTSQYVLDITMRKQAQIT